MDYTNSAHNMALNKFLVFVVLVTIIKRSTATTICDIEGGSCTYKVICKHHPGSASNPVCGGEPNVTFVITSSVANVITTSFFGATNFDGRVRSIEAINNTWTYLGNLAFRYYSKVKRIDLSSNFITEIQEETFRNLVSLNFLNLSSNLIPALHHKSLLITDAKSAALETLDLSNNKITFLSDEVLSYLPSLVNLYLQGNKLKRLGDTCFGSQKYLATLNLQHNYIERLNTSFVSLKQLVYLDLSFNNIKMISSYETNRLLALEKLNISSNVIKSIDSNCFRESKNLQTIDMSYNLINTAIDHAMFAENIKLDYLNFYGNLITGIEENSFMYNRLTYLNLEQNKLSGPINANTFAGLENITKLDLSQQNITMLRNDAFKDIKSLLHLNLSRNHINEVENKSFYNSFVSVLDLSYNNISKLYFLSNTLHNLTELYLNNNQIAVVNKNTFKKQELMKKLDLSDNQIMSIEENSLPLQNLQFLNLQNNRLTGVLRRDMLSPAKYLRFLDLSHFNITYIDNSTFIDMPVLARLNISHNSIDKVNSNNFRGMDNLYGLDISNNNLTDFQFNNSLLTNLKAAYLNNNKLTNISRIFPTTCFLLYLDLSHNGFSDLSSVGSQLFPEIQTLSLSNNNIENFNNPQTNTLSTIVDLRLSSNKIKNINLSYYKGLMFVDLSNNYISVINNTFFQNVDFIQSIDLSRNNISDVPPGTFLNMRDLKLLNLSSNSITTLRYGSLKGLHRTEFLDISYNKISSLDVNVFHECKALETLIIDYNRIKTLDVERLVLISSMKLTLSLGGNPISCQEIIRNVTLKDVSFNELYNRIQVTSIHKIYHEDNVHGIKCGGDDITTTVKVEEKVQTSENDNSSVVITVWCSILTVILVIICVVAYIKLRKKGNDRVFYRQSRVHLRNSLELDGSEYNVMN